MRGFSPAARCRRSSGCLSPAARRRRSSDCPSSAVHCPCWHGWTCRDAAAGFYLPLRPRSILPASCRCRYVAVELLIACRFADLPLSCRCLGAASCCRLLSCRYAAYDLTFSSPSWGFSVSAADILVSLLAFYSYTTLFCLFLQNSSEFDLCLPPVSLGPSSLSPSLYPSNNILYFILVDLTRGRVTD